MFPHNIDFETQGKRQNIGWSVFDFRSSEFSQKAANILSVPRSFDAVHIQRGIKKETGDATRRGIYTSMLRENCGARF